MATGVLLVCVGPATRLISYLQDTTKVYEADFLLGQTSNTDDITGEVASVELKASPPARKSVQAALDQMTGSIAQVPPSFSAVHVNGRRAYDLARRGEAVELVAREVQIDSIEIIRYEWPQLTVKVSCGSGTYIRSIARDLGEALGCGGLMSRLVRTRVGRFSITEALDADTISTETLQDHLEPASTITNALSQYRCTDADRTMLLCGKAVPVDRDRLVLIDRSRIAGPSTEDGPPDHEQVALWGEEDGQLWAVGEISRSMKTIHPRLVFVRP